MTDLTSPLGPTLETERLILRPPIASDFAGFCAMEADEETVKFLGGVKAPSVVWRNLRSMAGGWHLDGFHMFSVIEKSSSRWIGRVGPIYPHGWPGREIGWGLHASVWGKGYGREAAAVCMDYAFDVLGWERVIHSINPGNIASAALARSLGSTNMGPGRLPEPYADVAVDLWGQTRAEWKART